MAAVLAGGGDAVLSGPPAAWLWALIKGRPPAPEISAPRDHRVEGLRTRRRRLVPNEITTHCGIPITTVPLILLDLTPLMPEAELARACHEAGVKYRTKPAHVEDLLHRRPNLPGAARLRSSCAARSPSR